MASIFLPETALLQPVDPAQHSDDWPILELSGCDIYAQDQEDGGDDIFPDLSRGAISLLDADIRNPLLVRGRLHSVPRELAHLRLRRSAGTESLQLENVRQFSYGQYEDGRVEIWAAGAASWYAIRPSRAYKATYEHMLEGVKVMYFCTDVYEGQSTKSRKAKNAESISANSVLARYAAANGITHDTAEEVFGRHARFLFKSMLSTKETVNWIKTDLWTWMTGSFPETQQEVLEAQRQAGAALKATTKRKRNNMVKRSTTVSAKRQKGQAASQSTSMDDSDLDSIRPGKRTTRARKGKSALRPRPSKHVTREEDSIVVKLDDSDDHSDVQLQDYMGPSKSEKAHGKPHLSQLAGANESDDGLDGSSDETSASDSEDASESDISLSPLGGDLHITLQEEHLEATDPGDIWSCPLDGCMHRVFAASDHDSQRLIKNHYRQHADDDDAETRLELVRKMQGPGLSVNRLMSRIQAFTNQRPMPQPIVQRY